MRNQNRNPSRSPCSGGTTVIIVETTLQKKRKKSQMMKEAKRAGEGHRGSEQRHISI